jgi:uncharacterized iron-regulated membrane protein
VGRSAVRAWYLVHKWTSLICTVFLLMLCVTGLPLIFHDEIEAMLGDAPQLPAVAPGAKPPSLDQILARVLAGRPGEVVQNVSFDADRPVAIIATAPKPDSPFSAAHLTYADLRTGLDVQAPPRDKGFLWFMEELHETLFLDDMGTYFLGVMGTLFVVAIISGVVVYAPFMRKLDFGTVRHGRSTRLKWLDLHNLLGVATTAWLLVVGVTGVFNTLDHPLANQFRNGQLAEMKAPYAHAPPLKHLGSLDVAVATARRASPGMEPATIAFPGAFFGTPHHYNVFMRGASPVTKRLLKPTLVDAETGALTDTRDMPLHIQALFLSRPLHFGDYGGLFLKVVWAALDLVAIFVLVSGLYLWIGRRRAPLDRRVEELETGGGVEGATP